MPAEPFKASGRVSIGALAVALTLHVLKVVAEARPWHVIVRHAYPRARVTFGTTIGSFAGAIGANTVLPARIGEAMRFLGRTPRRCHPEHSRGAPDLAGNAGTLQAAFLVVLAGTGSLGAVLGFGVGMQAALTIVDLVVGGVAIWFVAPRADLAGFFGRLRTFGRTSPTGDLQAPRQTIRS